MQTMPILLIGLNHKVAPVEVRERLAFSPERIPDALNKIIDDGTSGVKEAVLLSTCNRTEIYICTCDFSEGETKLREFLAESANLSPDQLQSMLYVLQGDATAEHLMQVAAGLNSLVLGENEILGQVRAAAEMAHDAGATGPIFVGTLPLCYPGREACSYRNGDWARGNISGERGG